MFTSAEGCVTGKGGLETNVERVLKRASSGQEGDVAEGQKAKHGRALSAAADNASEGYRKISRPLWDIGFGVLTHPLRARNERCND